MPLCDAGAARHDPRARIVSAACADGGPVRGRVRADSRAVRAWDHPRCRSGGQRHVTHRTSRCGRHRGRCGGRGFGGDAVAAEPEVAGGRSSAAGGRSARERARRVGDGPDHHRRRRSAGRDVQRRRRGRLPAVAAGGDRPVARDSVLRGCAKRIARTSSGSPRPASRRGGWARMRCSLRCVPMARSSRSRRRSRSTSGAGRSSSPSSCATCPSACGGRRCSPGAKRGCAGSSIRRWT